MPTADRAKGAIPVRVKLAHLELTSEDLKKLEDKVSADVLKRLDVKEIKDRKFDSEADLRSVLEKKLNKEELRQYGTTIATRALKSSVPREEEGLFLKPDMSVIVSFLE
jgi:hypothetical protein